MTYNPNANWTAAIDSLLQAPVYFARLDGLTTKDYSTHPVKSAAVTKVILMDLPRGGGAAFDILEGTFSLQKLEFDLLDVNGEVTDLLATDAAGAPLATLINRKVTVYAGYADLVEADYAPIFTGRIVGVRALEGLTGYTFTLADLTWMLDGQIMTEATETTPATIEGNIVNVFWSILTGTFDTAHATFPLDLVSAASGSSSAPTGLGIATSLIDEAQLVSVRDIWHPGTRARAVFKAPVNAREELQRELFRTFQCWAAPTGSGQLSLRFVSPVASPLPVSEDDHIVGMPQWARRYDLHLNKFTYRGDWNPATNEFDSILYDEIEADDTTNQTGTGETIEYLVESKWLRSNLGGESAAREAAGRLRQLFRATPGEIGLGLNFRRRNAELGDVLAVTHGDIPDLLTGDRGVSDKAAIVVSITPQFEQGLVLVRCLDLGYLRFAGFAPNSQVDYDAASAAERSAYCFIGRDSDNKVGTALDPGYVMV